MESFVVSGRSGVRTWVFRIFGGVKVWGFRGFRVWVWGFTAFGVSVRVFLVGWSLTWG